MRIIIAVALLVNITPVSAQARSTNLETGERTTDHLDCFDPEEKVGDGTCDEGTFFNTEACNWDGGDCEILEYPNCHPPFPSHLGDGSCDLELNIQSCGYDLGDCDSSDIYIQKHTRGERTGAETVGIVFGAMAVVSLILLSQWVFIRSRNQYSNIVVAAADAVPRNAPNANLLLWNPAALFSRGTVRLNREKREQRILLVLDSIIRKKVLSKVLVDQAGQDDSDALVLPHEQTIATRSLKMSAHSHHSSAFTNKEDDDAFHAMDEEGGSRWRKDDIYIDSCSMHSMRQNMILASSHHSLLSPRSCPICYEKYKKGDEIAWSHNEECLHAFHVKCIIEWLIDNDECPMCRSNYICSVMHEFPISVPNEIQSSEVVDEDDGEGEDSNG